MSHSTHLATLQQRLSQQEAAAEEGMERVGDMEQRLQGVVEVKTACLPSVAWGWAEVNCFLTRTKGFRSLACYEHQKAGSDGRGIGQHLGRQQHLAGTSRHVCWQVADGGWEGLDDWEASTREAMDGMQTELAALQGDAEHTLEEANRCRTPPELLMERVVGISSFGKLTGDA